MMRREKGVTVFGFIVEGLRRRKEARLPAFTVMSCENLRQNGDTPRKAIVSFAKAKDPMLADWIDSNGAFPNSMVDRIAPQVSAEVRERLNSSSGLLDALPALSEDFMQFVLEDMFSDGRPDFAAVGVELRKDVGAFEIMKQRILNAPHMMLGYPGLLAGYRFVHEAMNDRRFFALLDNFVERDVIPNLRGPEGVSLGAYKTKVLNRFANPALGDQLERLSMGGWAKFPVYHFKILSDLLRARGDLRREAFFLACMERYLDGCDDTGQVFMVHDPHIREEDWFIIRGRDPAGYLLAKPFSNLGLAHHPEFRDLFLRYQRSLVEKGCGATLDGLLAETRLG